MIVQSPLLSAPIGRTILRLAAPNIVAMGATLVTSVAEIYYVGHLGTAALAGLAMAFPMMMLNLMVSAGSMGGAVGGAIAQRLGAGDRAGAEALALHAVLLSIVLAVLFAAVFLTFGPAIYGALGGRGAVLEFALGYSNMFFSGCLTLWLANTLSGIIRATGAMRVAATGLIAGSAVQVVVAGVLVFGLFGMPQMGIAGAAAGNVVGYGFATVLQYLYLTRRSPDLRLRLRGIPLSLAPVADLLRVGALASVSPFTSIATVITITALAARLGPDVLAGYGIGARLEFLMIPLVFGFGAATITLVGVHFGARHYARGLRIAWTAALFSAMLTGAIGGTMALFPGLWANQFTDSEAVREACSLYLRIVGPFYALFGLGQCLYFASQGARRMLWPVISSVLRFGVVLVGGIYLTGRGEAGAAEFFALIALALVVYAIVVSAAIRLGAWTRGVVPAEARAAVAG